MEQQAASSLTWLAVRAASNSNGYQEFLKTTTITTTSSNFTTFLTSMPWSTTFSNSAEVQVVLATFPLIALGFVGVGFAAFQLSVSRINRALLDLWIAIGTSFLSGIFDLFNVLNCELTAQPKMGHPLIIAESVSLATFLAFKLFYLFRRSQQPFQNESISVRGLPDSLKRIEGGQAVAGGGGESRWSKIGKAGGWGRKDGALVIHSGSYERWGIIGGVVKITVFLAIFVTGLLEAIWRIGFLSNFTGFFAAYQASNAFQIALLAFFGGKMVYAAFVAKAGPRRRNFVELAPTLFGISLALAVVIVNLIPGILRFSDTPLGRFFILIEMFIFILDATIQDHQRPYRDTLSFDDPNKSQSIYFDEKDSVKIDVPSSSRPETPNSGVEAPALPERIVVRRGSRLPSWIGGPTQRFPSNASDTQNLVQRPNPPSTTSTAPKAPSVAEAPSVYSSDTRRGDVGRSGNDDDSSSKYNTVYSGLNDSVLYSVLEVGSEEGDVRQSEVGRTINFGAPPPLPTNQQLPFSNLEPTNNLPFPTRPSNPTQATRPLDLSQAHRRKESALSVAPSVATYDGRGIRLSSPNLDLSFRDFNAIAEQQRAREARISAMPPPTTPPTNPLPPAPIRPMPKPVQQTSYAGPSSEYYAGLDVINESSEGKTSQGSLSDPSLERRSEASLATNATHLSDMSLSHFPQPPLIDNVDPLRLDNATSVVTDGLEFELLPPRPAFRQNEGRVRVDSQQTQGTTFDITSMILDGDLYQPGRTTLELDRITESESGSEDYEPIGSLPVSPGASEVGEIRKATIVPRSLLSGPRSSGAPSTVVEPVHKRKDSALKVEEKGRVIPPRADQDQERRTTFVSVPAGLPSNPKRGPRSPQQDVRSESSSPTTVVGSPQPQLVRFKDYSAGLFSPPSEVVKKFEKPRPAPLVLGAPKASVQPLGVGVPVVAPERPSAVPKRSFSKARAEKKTIVILRGNEESEGMDM